MLTFPFVDLYVLISVLSEAESPELPFEAVPLQALTNTRSSTSMPASNMFFFIKNPPICMFVH
jgi:hypothetical protein